jgi:hypothetical protein
LWNVKVDPIEKPYPGDGNNRSVYPDQEVLQVLGNALEKQPDESGEVNACQRRWTLTSPIGVGRRRLEFDAKVFEVGQPGQGCDYRFGGKVPRMWYVGKIE